MITSDLEPVVGVVEHNLVHREPNTDSLSCERSSIAYGGTIFSPASVTCQFGIDIYNFCYFAALNHECFRDITKDPDGKIVLENQLA